MPAGITLIAPAGKDALIAELGDRFHRAAGVSMGATGNALPASRPRISTASKDEIELVVVGAHLSGMALNHELQAVGARLLRQGETRPDYRLYALQGSGPRRPGLVRVPAGQGTPITVEVWGLPPEGFGRFVAAVPSPLCIGTLHLADGTRPKGFLCENIGTEGAEDISALGGWRTFVENGFIVRKSASALG